MHTIEYSAPALKTLRRMPADLRALVKAKIAAVAVAPHAQHANVTRLQGRPEFRLRVHDWRVIYRVLDDRVVLLVIKIGVRGQVYE